MDLHEKALEERIRMAQSESEYRHYSGMLVAYQRDRAMQQMQRTYMPDQLAGLAGGQGMSMQQYASLHQVVGPKVAVPTPKAPGISTEMLLLMEMEDETEAVQGNPQDVEGKAG